MSNLLFLQDQGNSFLKVKCMYQNVKGRRRAVELNRTCKVLASLPLKISPIWRAFLKSSCFIFVLVLTVGEICIGLYFQM